MCRFPAANELFRCCLAGAMLLAGALAVRGDDDQALDQFLARLGLADLRLTHMERRLARAEPGDQRTALARKLADAYAEELIAAADESEKFGELKARVEKLLTEVPDARTAAVEVVLLQAEYQHAEALLLGWQEDPSSAAKLKEAGQIFQSLVPAFSGRQKELTEQIDRLSDSIDSMKLESQRQAAEERLKRQQAVAARADYFVGWSAYYLGITKQNPPLAAGDFTAAKEHFLHILDVADERGYEDVEAESIGLESVWRSRAVIGLGLAEIGLGRLEPAQRIFAWLQHASAPPAIRDQAAYWHLQGLLNVRLLDEAARLANVQVATFSGSASPGKSSLCITAIRAAAANPAGQPLVREQLLSAGIRGLARLRQFETLDKLIDQYQLENGEATDFQLAWLRGRRQYLAAEKAKDASGFQAAAETLTKALSRPQARTDVNEAGQARYYLAWARYRLEEYEAAGRVFHEATTVLRTSLPDVALQAAWMHATCLVQLAAKDKRRATAAIAALQAFKQEYPASEESHQAELLMTRLRHSHASPEAAIRELAAVKPSDPTYLSGQYEICLLRYQLWSKAKGDAAKAQPLAEELLTSVDQFLAAASKTAEGERRLKAALLAVDVLSAASPPENGRIAALLADVGAAAERMDASDRAAAEYYYRALQLAQRSGDGKSLHAAADWLSQHGRGTPYELPGLVIVARAADQGVQSAAPAEKASKTREAAAIYARLVSLFGESPKELSTNKNALAAASKLAQYDELLGRWPEAADRYGRLVAAAPRDRRLLRHAGLACFQAGRFAESLEHWRNLLAGTESGGDDWLEAKYYQLLCLEKTDPAAARQVLKQFKVLFPEVKSAAWRDKFAELEHQLQTPA
jgi:hypothetical protein